MSDAEQTDSFLTSIREALKAKENNAVLALLEGRDVKIAIDSGKQTLLHLAAAYGNAFITDYLIKSGCTVDATDKDEITPLVLAILFCHVEVTRILIDAGADLCRVDSKGISPSFYIKMANDEELIEIWTSADKGKKVCNEDKAESAERLYQSFIISLSSPVEEGDSFWTFFLCSMPDYRMRDSFNESKCDILLLTAIILGQNFFTKISSSLPMFFYYADADVNFNNSVALHLAATSFNNVAITWLLNRGADVNVRAIGNLDRTPLHTTLNSEPIWKQDSTVELLLRNGADLHAISYEDETILKAAQTTRTRARILRELTLLEAQGKPLNAIDLKIVKSDSEMNRYYKLCKNVLQKAKEFKILEDTTLFDLMTKNMQTLTAYAKSKNFREKFASLKVSDQFPMISDYFLREFIQYLDLINTTEQATVALGKALPFLDDLVITRIIKYLTPGDLQLLAQF